MNRWTLLGVTCSCCTLSPSVGRCVVSSAAVSVSQQSAVVCRFVQRPCRFWSRALWCLWSSTPETFRTTLSWDIHPFKRQLIFYVFLTVMSSNSTWRVKTTITYLLPYPVCMDMTVRVRQSSFPVEMKGFWLPRTLWCPSVCGVSSACSSAVQDLCGFRPSSRSQRS